ncbi:PREDICTED: afadin isoform X4 [Ceratotherium simum simum]|uniref:Afadin isoform X4 n=1 Tax=Ceratotherium simum simum TaxID=73337 RepID=A0ABM1DGD3_CERSS|nr:PREDICTED: afadin isoform X4 [Ceratotherium simum simum]
MRFYFQDKAAGNFATKCIRVSSTATTQDVIETLAEKFRPDMRMLSSPKYSLYEVHVSGEERRLDIDEKPLVVQLNWNKDDREGRFVLKNENDAIPPKKVQSNGPEKQEKEGVIQNFKRTLSKKEKKEKKKREKEAVRQASDKEDRPFQGDDIENSRLAAEVYKDMPETSFTRTISNPEVVMKRRRQQKLEKRMQEFRSSDGRPDSGGTLRIYADSLKPNIPYKTILLSTTDPADFAVAEALEKYGLEKENPQDYCIARVMLPPGAQHSDEKGAKEIILDDDECPLQIFREWPSDKGILVFQLKRRPPDCIPKKTKKHSDGKPVKGKERADGSGYGSALPPEKLPYLVELSPDGSDSRDKPKLYRLQLSVTEVGTEKFDDNSIQLFGSGIQPHHCDLTNMDGVVTVTPRSMDAETYVEGQRISETTMLQSGMKVQFGASHVFKFVDPSQDHALTKRPVDGGVTVKGPRHKPGVVQETTFDLGGDVHSGTALPTSKSTTRLDSDRVPSASSTAERGTVKPMIREQQQDYRRQESRTQDVPGPELILPASIEFRESSEDSFLSAIINYTNSSTVHFKLSPTYVLYMACRYVLSSQYRPDVSPTERTHKVIAIVNKMVSMMEGVIQEVDQVDQKQKNIAGALAFWMANASELLNFIKQDRDLSRITLDAQDVLAHLVQMAFKYLVHCLQSELNNYMPAFLDDPEENSLQRPKIDDVLHTLTGAMSLLRRCRVNAALTIQLFSQLFHFINMWLFNRLVTDPESGLCSHYWGAIIRQQLGHVEAWAEKQGLELAADCHLSRIVQATTLLTMDKYAPDDIPNINSTCFKLNSLQLQALLQNYHCAPDEPFIPADLIENVVAMAENTADELARSDGREVQLEEDPDLQLPFLLPEDGYSCDVVRNIPNGLQEFLDPLCQRGFCRLIPHARSPGTWTIYFEGADYESHLMRENTELAQPLRKEPEIITVTLKKQNGMGLSIVAAKGAGQDKLGIYVKSVVKGGAADVDGRLAAGDQLLSVDGRSLVGLSQERAAELMTRTSSVVTLEVAKQGAIYHGLATLLNQPSPMMQRISDRRGSGKPRPKSEGFELYNNSAQNGSPESPQLPWAEYSEPKKLPGDDRLMKNRADHRSSPNVANQPPSPGGKSAYAPGTTAKITSVSTGNLCSEEQTPPPRPEAYPIPTQTYTREYFTFPASKSQDRMAPPQNQWPDYEEKPHVHTDSDHSSVAAQRVTRSQEELREDKAYHLERHQMEAVMDRKAESEMWINQNSSMGSSTSSQEHLDHSSKAGTPASTLTKSGPGRWKTPAAVQPMPVAVSQPIRTDLPPPPPPPPVHYASDFDGIPMDLPLPPPPSASQIGPQPAQVAAAERKKREEHQRWYEKEKARLEEERERKRREQERKLGQMRTQALNPTQFPPLTAQQMKPEKPSTLQRPQETVIRELQPQQQPRTIERRDLQYITISKEELSSGDSLSPDPWKRDAKEKLEKQQQMHIVDMLSKEIQELQSKPDRTAEENDRLRKLMLEWQFQKRLQESKQKDEDDEEEEDDDVDTMLIMQRLEAERRARQTALPAISVLDLDEERRRQQQLEEMRKREAEDRARQEEERRRQEEERIKRDAEEKRRQEEGYYSRLEAERRRQHDEAERRLLEPEEPGLCRPPLPRGYELPSPSPPANAPPPPPQRTASYLQTQVLSPDSLYTAKFVAYNEEEEEEEEHCSLAGPNSYMGSTGTVIGAHDVYRDSREKLSKSQDADLPGSSGAPENLTFKERQRLFSQGQDVSNKVKASRKLTELENELNTK